MDRPPALAADTPTGPASHTFEVAGAADAARLARLAAETFPLACPSYLPAAAIADKIASALSQQCFEQYLASPDHLIMLALDSYGEPVGYTMSVRGVPDPGVAALLPAGPTAELSKCYTVARAHGTGVAGALMRTTLARVQRWQLAGMWLGVNQLNARAQRFYASHGFSSVGTRQFAVGDYLCDDFVMWRYFAR